MHMRLDAVGGTQKCSFFGTCQYFVHNFEISLETLLEKQAIYHANANPLMSGCRK